MTKKNIIQLNIEESNDFTNFFKTEGIITNVGVFDLEETLIASGYAMIEEYDETQAKLDSVELWIEKNSQNKELIKDNKHFKRALRLSKAPLNSGHVSFAKGIVVNMDITFSNKAWIEFQRYHFADIITGMSTMHRISKFDLTKAFNEYVDGTIIHILMDLQKEYKENPTKENYLKLLYSTPSGLLMTNRVTTNYLQLMNMYAQRHNHRLPEWRQFCEELLEKLPLFKELLIANGQIKEEKLNDKKDIGINPIIKSENDFKIEITAKDLEKVDEIMKGRKE